MGVIAVIDRQTLIPFNYWVLQLRVFKGCELEPFLGKNRNNSVG